MDLNNMTYSQAEGVSPFDWNAFLAKEQHTEDECLDASTRAEDWVTCACGNQCAAIPRDKFTGSPCDVELATLGYEFSQQIDIQEFAAAKETLLKIEARSAFLLSQL